MNNLRYNIYTLIHKALRASMCQNLIELGRLDDTDTEAVTEQLQATQRLLEFCQSHLQHENEFIHSAILTLQPSSSLHTAEDHIQHEREISRLLKHIAHIAQLPALRRQQALLEFYSQFTLFVAENFQHMNIEETHNSAILWDHFSDAQIHEIEQKIVASLTPEDNLYSLLLMLPHISHRERVQLLNGMRQGAPLAVVVMVMEQLRSLISATAWHKLSAELELIDAA